MFEKPTVFVLGAGASWHYGYPTGAGLIDEVVSVANTFVEQCDLRIHGGKMDVDIPKYVSDLTDSKGNPSNEISIKWSRARKEARTLIETIHTVRPLVIDYFLEWCEPLRNIGKLMIAAALIKAEREWPSKQSRSRKKYPANNDWYRFIVHRLAYGCKKDKDLFLNKFNIITFNYDTSIERKLYSALDSINLFGGDIAYQFLQTDNRIIHVYGALSDQPLKSKMIPNIDDGQYFWDHCWEAAQTIRTIETVDKENGNNDLVRAKQLLQDASRIYVLGFGFDKLNCERIGLDTNLGRNRASGRKQMFVTNFDDHQSINKRICHILQCGMYEPGDESVPLNNAMRVEKSVRNVYDALAVDFEEMEY